MTAGHLKQYLLYAILRNPIEMGISVGCPSSNVVTYTTAGRRFVGSLCCIGPRMAWCVQLVLFRAGDRRLRIFMSLTEPSSQTRSRGNTAASAVGGEVLGDGLTAARRRRTLFYTPVWTPIQTAPVFF